MKPVDAYALGLSLLGLWGLFSSRKSFKRARGWSRRRWQIFLIDVPFAGGCFLAAGGLHWGWFRAWLLVPLGASYLWMIPLPCYFEAVDRIGWLHTARNLLFLLVALFCFVTALGLLPLSLLGL